jgi:hypothetical protein
MAQKWLELADDQRSTEAFNDLWQRFNEQQLLGAG